MVKLFVFKAVGSYFGGAIGVKAKDAMEAASIVNLSSEECKKRIADWHNEDESSLSCYPDCEVTEEVLVTDIGDNKDRFVLAHVYELSGEHDCGLEFIYKHEG